MATLVFRVSSDWEQVVKLRQECEKLEAQLKKMDVNKSPAAARALETQLASARQQMMGLKLELQWSVISKMEFTALHKQ